MAGLLKVDEKQEGASRVEQFLARKGFGLANSGRLIFALDATASRQATWNAARELTAGMIAEASSVGRLSLQLVYFKGGMGGAAGRCVASAWTDDPGKLSAWMNRVTCETGFTQITRVLRHAQSEALIAPVGALVYVGDMCEPVNDDLDKLSGAALALGKLKTPVFAFQEGQDPEAEKAFREIARLSGGAYGRFDSGGAKQLSELLRGAATFAVGGLTALEGRKDSSARLLLQQLTGGKS
jgi:hypothetical protein